MLTHLSPMWVFLVLVLLVGLSASGSSGWECLDVPSGEANMKIDEDVEQKGLFLFIHNIAPLSCICQTVVVENIQKEEFMGVQGAMLHGDCGAMRYFTRQSVENWREWAARSGSSRPFTYVETGAYMGLSATIVTASAQALGAPVIAYSHDLFNEAVTDLWDLTGLKGEGMGEGDQGEQGEGIVPMKTNLQLFYSNVRRNNLTRVVIPIAGPSSETLNIHEPGSVDMVFIDGDHTYEGALADLREAWKILRVGGLLLGHDCFPESSHVFHQGMGANGVRAALKQFVNE
ncbi:hypothetical protein B484DRAFT_457613, partial [Ochromonadaceae sp. CCMP2298]